MFDVYLNDKRELLVIEKGTSLPLLAAPGKWRKRKKKVFRVSLQIRSEVQDRGYYLRKLTHRNSHPPA
jgi:hypothetical protein